MPSIINDITISDKLSLTADNLKAESSIDVPPFMGFITLFFLLTFALGVSFGYYLGAREAARIVTAQEVK